MHSKPIPCVVLFVADVHRMTDFYRAIAGMHCLHQDDEHTILETGGMQLVLHKIHGEPDLQSASGDNIMAREDVYLKLCLPVDSIHDARIKAASCGGQIKSQEHEWEARGFRACDGVDPEGNVFQVRQTAT